MPTTPPFHGIQDRTARPDPDPAPDTSPAAGGLILYGDPHGTWTPLFEACRLNRPAAVLILGDLGLDIPFRQRLAPLLEAGIDVRWLMGNHDRDSEELFDNVVGDYPDGEVGPRPVVLAGIRVAALGGTFKQRVWYPRDGTEEPAFQSRADYLRALTKTSRWRGGLPLRMRDTVFPEDVEALDGATVDLLVTHEAPSTHRFGFAGINRAVRLCRARLVVHGHHHESTVGMLPGGVRVRGLAKAEVLRIHSGDLP